MTLELKTKRFVIPVEIEKENSKRLHPELEEKQTVGNYVETNPIWTQREMKVH